MQQWDLIIIGAGLSGIDAACHFSMHCPEKRYTIFEARDNIGGTWDLFTYPGIRSDSDMHTFSYRFKPWTYPKTVSDAATIMAYLEETVEEYEVQEHIQFHHRIERIDWSSAEKRWTVTGTNTQTGDTVMASCQFIMVCTGYYDYEQGYTPEFAGLDQFEGEFIHPQAWHPDVKYQDKEIIVIGSGATAVTLIPALAEKARHVTMLQRSPSYILSRPLYDPFAKWAHRLLPAKAAHVLSRWKNILLSMYLYRLSKKKSGAIQDYIKGKITEVLGKDYDLDTHFSPRYQPWDERLCAVPDNDLFLAIKEEKCTVVTDQIDTFTKTGIRLQSGTELSADLVISATGLNLKMAGGMTISLDGQPVDISQLVNYKGVMLQNLPNLAIVMGYTNASWTLKADLACTYVCRLLQHMDRHGYQSCTPRLSGESLETAPIIDFTSGYIQRSLDLLPKQGDQFPWRLHQNYLKDLIILQYRKIEDGHLEFG